MKPEIGGLNRSGNRGRPAAATLAIALAALISLAAPLTSATHSTDDQSLEYRVKAAFLLNFTRFVEWPRAALASDTAPISVCILGDDPFGAALDQVVQGEAVNAHRLVVQRLHQAPAPGACQVLFFAKTEKDAARIIADLGPGVLTVGEGESFVHEGGVIAFVIENRRVRFDINQNAAAKAYLKLNAKLLSVARSVEK